MSLLRLIDHETLFEVLELSTMLFDY